MKTFKPGDRVIITREPSQEEWKGIGEILLPESYKDKVYTVERLDSRKVGLEIEENPGCWYPAAIFELSTPKYETTKYEIY